MKKRKIVIFQAISDTDSITFYSKEDFFIASYIDEILVIIKRKKDFQKEVPKEDTDLNAKIRFAYLTKFSIGTLVLGFSSLFFFLFISSLVRNQILYILSPFLSVCLAFCFSFWYFFIEGHRGKLKSYHSAEHKMYNFIKDNGRLPISLQELRNSTRFSIDCSSLVSFMNYLSSYCAYLRSYSIFVLGIYLSLSLNSSLPILIKLFIFLFISIIVFGKKIYQKLLETPLLFLQQYANFFCQLFTTTKKVSDDALILVYHLAKTYIREEYPEYLEEEWMQYNPEFDMLKTQVKFINLT